MLRALRNLFNNSKTAQPAPLAADRDAFLRDLGTSAIFIIAALQSDGIDPKGLTKEQLLAEIERAARDLNERQGFKPFVHDLDGQRRLPFFTTMKYAEIFIGWYSMTRNRVFPFQVLGLKGALLAKALPGCDVLVMNDRSADEVEFSEDDAATIERLWT